MNTNSKSYFGDCTFEDNKNYLSGGAIFVDSEEAEVTVENSKFIGNTALRGGAVYCHVGSVFTSISTIYERNRAFEGGVLYINDQG